MLYKKHSFRYLVGKGWESTRELKCIHSYLCYPTTCEKGHVNVSQSTGAPQGKMSVDAFTLTIQVAHWTLAGKGMSAMAKFQASPSVQFFGHHARSLRVISVPTILQGPRCHELRGVLPACPRPQGPSVPPPNSYALAPLPVDSSAPLVICYLQVLLFVSISVPAGNKEHTLTRIPVREFLMSRVYLQRCG